MAKLFKKLFMLFMVITFILSAFGCNEDITKGKEQIHYEETGIYETYNEETVFKSCDELKNFVTDDPFFEDNYYIIINTEAFYKKPISTYREPPQYTFKYNKNKDEEYLETQLMINGILTDKNAPKKQKGCAINVGGTDWTCSYVYYAYPTKEIDTPLTFNHLVMINKRDSFSIIIQICQGENIIGIFSYLPDEYDDEYYEKFLKENLIIIGGNNDET